MRRLLPAVLLVAAAQQPVAGVVFVLDGVLIGAGDQDYLALAGLAAAGVFAAGAALVIAEHGGLVALWLAFSLWLLARFVTLTLRARSSPMARHRRGPPLARCHPVSGVPASGRLVSGAGAGTARAPADQGLLAADGHVATVPEVP